MKKIIDLDSQLAEIMSCHRSPKDIGKYIQSARVIGLARDKNGKQIDTLN